VEGRSVGYDSCQSFVRNHKDLFENKDYQKILSRAAEYLSGDDRETLVKVLMEASGRELKGERNVMLIEIIKSMVTQMCWVLNDDEEVALADLWLESQPNVISASKSETIMGFTLNQVFYFMLNNQHFHIGKLNFKWDYIHFGESLVRLVN
jgi:hypothetical protein